MATLYPEYLDPINDNAVADRNNARQSAQRKLLFGEWVYEFTGDEVAADIIELSLDGQKFPKGTTVFPQLSYAFVETDCATTLTLDVGDLDTAAASAAYKNGDAYAVAHVASDADRYADGLDAGAVGSDVFASGVAANIPHTLQEDCMLTCTLKTLVTPVAGGRLRLLIAYFVN